MFYILDITKTCSSSALAIFMGLIKTFLNIMQIAAPILLMISLSISFFKYTTNPDDKKSFPKIRNAIIATIVFFFLPMIVNVSMGAIGERASISSCWINAPRFGIGSTYVPVDNRNRKSINPGGNYQKSGSSSGNNSNNGSSSGSVDTTNYTGTYYPALKGSSFRISGASTTGGCANKGKVYHDLSISEGNKIYAAFDGELKYIQFTCKGVLFSYGNQAKLTDKKTGTFVLYGHLSEFVGASGAVTKTCHKVYGRNASCGAGACSSGVKKTTVLTKNVKRGELIGYTGNTGNSDGPHLHVEIHEKGSRNCLTDPYKAMGMR